MIFIGVDFGDARVGLAKSDPAGILAGAVGTLKVRGLADAAEQTGAEVVFVDERLSTVEAYTYMNITGLPGTKRKGKIDALSAQIILQSYLDAKKNG